ncbi:PKD domain-containing protein [Kaarinaea lacus]
MNTRQPCRTVFALAVTITCFLIPQGVVALPGGISGYSGANTTCTACHPQGTAPTVTLTSSGSTTVTPGSTDSYTLTITGGAASSAGFDISANAGVLVNTAASGVRVSNTELVHNSPASMSGGTYSMSFDWQAPTAAGTYTIYAAGMSTNGNGGTSGDGTGTTTLQVTVSQPTNQTPVAVITAPTTGIEGNLITFNGSGSSDSDGTIVAYDWTFDDGSAASGVEVQHAFAAGTYTVTLMVTDNDGAFSHATQVIEISATNVPPVAAISGPSNGTEGVAVTFNGTGSADSDGTIATYEWDFGDSSAGSGPTVSHTYAAGAYTVTLTVTDNDGATDQATLNITIVPATNPQPPVADAGGPYNGTVDVAVQFDGTGSTDTDGSIVSYAWDFGDGNSGTGVGPVHIYTTAGTYDVTLTVTDDSGDTGNSQTTAVIVAAAPPPQAPIADAGGPYSGTVNVAVQFDGSGSTDPDGNIVSYEWDFGDGNTGTGVSPSHTYTAAGTYDVQLTVTDDSGDTNSNQTTAEIGETTPPTTPTPPTETETDGETLYNTYCTSCHGAKGSREFNREVRGEDARDIVEAIDEYRDMRFLDNILTSDDIAAIAAYINDTTAPGDGDGGLDPGYTEEDSKDVSDGEKSHDADEKPSDMSKDNPFGDKDSRDNKKRSFDELGAGALHWLILALAVVMFNRRRKVAMK